MAKKHDVDSYGFPEVIEHWPDSLREQEEFAQRELSDKELLTYQWEYLFNGDGET